jgi:hypothetical protein
MAGGDGINVTRNMGYRTESIGSDSTDSITEQIERNVYRLKGNDLKIARSDSHISMSSSFSTSTSYDFDDSDMWPEDQREDSNVTNALKPLRDRKLKTIRGGSAIFGAGVGAAGGGVAGALKLAAIGAVIGTMVMPGIGTGVGAVIGAVVGVIGGGLAGGAVGGTIGHFVGKNQAAKIDLESVMADFAPDTKTFEKLAKDAGIDPENLHSDTKDRIMIGLGRALRNRVETGRPLGREFLRATLSGLIIIHGRPNIPENDKTFIANNFLDQLRIPGRTDPQTMDATLDALFKIYGNEDLDSIQKAMIGSKLIQELAKEADEGRAVSPAVTRLLTDRFIESFKVFSGTERF